MSALRDTIVLQDHSRSKNAQLVTTLKPREPNLDLIASSVWPIIIMMCQGKPVARSVVLLLPRLVEPPLASVLDSSVLLSSLLEVASVRQVIDLKTTQSISILVKTVKWLHNQLVLLDPMSILKVNVSVLHHKLKKFVLFSVKMIMVVF